MVVLFHPMKLFFKLRGEKCSLRNISVWNWTHRIIDLSCSEEAATFSCGWRVWWLGTHSVFKKVPNWNFHILVSNNSIEMLSDKFDFFVSRVFISLKKSKMTAILRNYKRKSISKDSEHLWNLSSVILAIASGIFHWGQARHSCLSSLLCDVYQATEA